MNKTSLYSRDKDCMARTVSYNITAFRGISECKFLQRLSWNEIRIWIWSWWGKKISFYKIFNKEKLFVLLLMPQMCYVLSFCQHNMLTFALRKWKYWTEKKKYFWFNLPNFSVEKGEVFLSSSKLLYQLVAIFGDHSLVSQLRATRTDWSRSAELKQELEMQESVGNSLLFTEQIDR